MGEIPTSDWSWIDATANRFEQAWKRGMRPRIEDDLAKVDEPRRPALLQELLGVERELRRAGDRAPREDYLRRFPRYGDIVAVVFDGEPAGSDRSGESGGSSSPTEASRFERGSSRSLPPELASHPDYQIIRELGRGGMGVVYLAHNRLMARDEVLKVMARQIVEEPGVLDRFLREIRAVARLRHPNIVSAYSAFRCSDDLVFAMEYVAGLNLAQMVKANGALPVRQACAYIHQAALGLQYAHEEGMVHRDIKPANLMLSHQKERAVIKLLDFGLSKAASEQNAAEIGIAMAIDAYDLGEHLTCTGDMLGTPDFIAPEQIANSQQADIRADIYSLGCTLYYLLSGQAPFPNLPLQEVLRAHRSLSARRLDHVRDDVPADLSSIVARMMAKEPADRFPEPAEVAEALKPFFKKAIIAGERSTPDNPESRGSMATPQGIGGVTMAPVATNVAAGVPTAAGIPSNARPPDSTLAGLIDLSDTHSEYDLRDRPSPKAGHTPGPRGEATGHGLLKRLWRPRARLWSAIAGVLTLSLLTAWAALSTGIRKDGSPPGMVSREAASEAGGPGPPHRQEQGLKVIVKPQGPPERALEGGGPGSTRPQGQGPMVLAGMQGPTESASASGGPDPTLPKVGPPPDPAKDPTAPVLDNVPHPFRLATHGLGGREYIDPISLKPDWSESDEPGTARAWAAREDFARLTSRTAIGYPRLSETRYVLDLDLTVNAHGEVELQLGDKLHHYYQLRFAWKDDRKVIECLLQWKDYGTMWTDSRKGIHDFAPGQRISLAILVGDAKQVVFHDGALILSSHGWPMECGLRIVSYKPDSGVIHRCSLRRLTAKEAADCGLPERPTVWGVVGESKARLGRMFGNLRKDHPRRGRDHRFAVRTTGTPMVWIKPGEFTMGPRDPKDEGRHRVRLTQGYWMAQIEVTQAEFQTVTNGNPSRISGSRYLPVDWVAWDQAVAYCRKLTELERKAGRLPSKYEYRLPTEAEWEYACRADSDEDFSVPKEMIWSADRGACRPHEVAESQPNLWGLFDMHGNAMEWCLDAWYDYPKGSKEVAVDPFTPGRPDQETSFVIRGGAWWSSDDSCKSGWRARNPNAPNGFRGFRIVLGPELPAAKDKD